MTVIEHITVYLLLVSGGCAVLGLIMQITALVALYFGWINLEDFANRAAMVFVTATMILLVPSVILTLQIVLHRLR